MYIWEFRERKFDTSVSGSSLRKRAGHSPMYPDSTHGIPKCTFQVSTRSSLALSLRPLSRSLPALSSAVLPLEEELSASDAMENEADLWEI